LKFADVTVPAPGAGGGVTSTQVPNVVGLAQASAVTALSNAQFVAAATGANSTTVPIGVVISQNPAAGTSQPFGSTVGILVSLGALVPNVVGATQTAGTATLAAAGLTVGSVTSVNNAAAAGTVISQSPAAGTSTAPGTGVALTVSLGPALRTVPNVVNLTQAAATTAIQNAGLSLGAVTNAASTTVARGSVISSNPVAGTNVPPGSAVAIVVSSGAPQPAGLVLALAFDEAAGTTALDSSVSAKNGTIRQALRVPGKFGGALKFDGFDDWVTVTDTTASPLDLTTGMTLEAWVNPALMSGWETVMYKERGIAGEGLLSYALYAHDGAPLNLGFPTPAGYVRLTPVASTTDSGARGTTQVPLNTWTHLATTYDGSSQRFYVNGVLVRTVANPGTIVQANGALRIGGNASSTGEFFQGLIDEVRVYNRALSAAEIATDMTTAIVR
jgi:beta-lactam-binding protein with PASTA domain